LKLYAARWGSSDPRRGRELPGRPGLTLRSHPESALREFASRKPRVPAQIDQSAGQSQRKLGSRRGAGTRTRASSGEFVAKEKPQREAAA
jgi:hypothetical protein